MARIRTIKPDFWHSSTMASQEPLAVLTFIGLMGHADDEGRCKDRPALVKAAVHPLREEVTTQVVAAHLEALIAAGAVCRYDVDGEQYLHLPFFSQNQVINRPKASTLPPCALHECSVTDQEGRTDHRVTDQGVSTHEQVQGHGGFTLEGKGVEKEKEKEAETPPPPPPLLALLPPATQPALQAQDHDATVDALVDLYAGNISESAPDRVASLRKEAARLLAGGAGVARLRVAVLDLAKKDVHPRSLEKFVEHARLPSANASAVPTKSDQEWKAGF